MSESTKGLGDREDETRSQRVIDDMVIQLNRMLRIACLHRTGNEAFRSAVDAFMEAVSAGFRIHSSLKVQVSQGALFVNGRFLKVKGSLYEATEKLKEVFERLEINEIEFGSTLDRDELVVFGQAFHEAWTQGRARDLVSQRFTGIVLTLTPHAEDVDVDRKVELARSYAQLVVMLQEAEKSLSEGRVFSMANLRRSAQQLMDASDGQWSLLSGITLFDSEDRGVAEHGAACAAWVLRAWKELGLTKKEGVNLALAASLHHLRRTTDASESDALAASLALAPLTANLEALDRISLCFECGLPANGKRDSLKPRSAAQFIALACAYDRMLFPSGQVSGLSPGRAIALLSRNQEGFFDPKALRFFVSLVGRIPVGSWVRLSDGHRAVVLSTDEPPTVRVTSDGRDRIVDLSQSDVGIEEILEPSDEDPMPIPFLLA